MSASAAPQPLTTSGTPSTQVTITTESNAAQNTPIVKFARTDRFTGNSAPWSPQKLIVTTFPGFMNVTAVKVIVAPLGSCRNPSCTAVTIPLTV